MVLQYHCFLYWTLTLESVCFCSIIIPLPLAQHNVWNAIYCMNINILHWGHKESTLQGLQCSMETNALSQYSDMLHIQNT